MTFPALQNGDRVESVKESVPSPLTLVGPRTEGCLSERTHLQTKKDDLEMSTRQKVHGTAGQ